MKEYEFDAYIEIDDSEIEVTILFEYMPASPQYDDCPAWGEEINILSVTRNGTNVVTSNMELVIEELCSEHIALLADKDEAMLEDYHD